MHILHISDVHFGISDDSGTQTRITKGLSAAIESIADEPTLIIFSGDLANSGTAAQFEIGQKWLKSIIPTKWQSKLIIVPGNHDVDRNIAKPNKAWLRPLSEPQAYSSARQMLSENVHHLANFFEFHRAASHDLPIIGDWSSNPFGYHVTTLWDNLPVHVIALNSALFSCDEDDEKNLVVDLRFLNESLGVCEENPGLNIVVSHHPLSWLKDQNRAALESFLCQDNGAHLFFSGHLHSLETRFTASTSSGSLIYLSSGAAYQTEKYPNIFSLIKLDFKAKRLKTTVYKYDNRSGKWLIENSLALNTPAELPEIIDLPIMNSKKTVLGSKADQPRDHVKINTDKNKGFVEKKIRETMDYDKDGLDLRLRAALKVEATLRPYFDTIDIKGYKHGMKSRVKIIERIVEKIASRRLTNPNYQPENLVDICGFRLITYYQDQIPSILSNMLHSIKNNGAIGGLSVLKDGIEIDVNTNRPENDPISLIQDIKQVVKSCDLNVKLNFLSRPTGYSSVHFVINTVFTPPFEGVIKQLPVEIQIRSVLEDIWSDIDRNLRYFRSRGGVGPSWAMHLNVFKHMIDALDQYADMIQMHAKAEITTPPEEIKRSRTITTSQEQIKWIKTLNLSPVIVGRIEKAYALWDQAEAERATGGDPSLRRQVAEAFFSITVDADDEFKGNQRGKDEVQILIWGESAYMLMYTGDANDQQISEQNYKSILNKRSNDSTAHFRLGTLYLLKKDYNNSVDFFNKCLNILVEGKDNRVDQNHWIFDKARLSIGLISWFRSQGSGTTLDDKKREIISALEISLSIVRRPSNEATTDNIFYTAVNDFLYYCYEANNLFKIDINAFIKEDELNKYIDILYDFVLSAKDCEYNFIDTILRFKDKDQGINLATRLKEKLVKTSEIRNKSAIPHKSMSHQRWIAAIARRLDTHEEDSFHFALEALDRWQGQS